MSNETGIKKYEIEKSRDGNNFTLIGTLNAVKITRYNYTDPVQNGYAYYRIKTIAQDGTYSYSKIVRVAYNSNHSMGVYPNPVTNNLIVSGLVGKSTLTIINQTGETLLTQKAFSTSYTLPPSKLKAGVYTLLVSNESTNTFSTKIIKN